MNSRWKTASPDAAGLAGDAPGDVSAGAGEARTGGRFSAVRWVWPRIVAHISAPEAAADTSISASNDISASVTRTSPDAAAEQDTWPGFHDQGARIMRARGKPIANARGDYLLQRTIVRAHGGDGVLARGTARGMAPGPGTTKPGPEPRALTAASHPAEIAPQD